MDKDLANQNFQEIEIRQPVDEPRQEAISLNLTTLAHNTYKLRPYIKFINDYIFKDKHSSV